MSSITRLVREPDAEGEPAPAGCRCGEGLAGEHHRVAGVGGHHRGAQLDAGTVWPMSGLRR